VARAHAPPSLAATSVSACVPAGSRGGESAPKRSRARRADAPPAVSGAPPEPRGRRAARGSGTRTGSGGAARAALASSSPLTWTRSPAWKHFDYGRWGLGPVLTVQPRIGWRPLCHPCVGHPVACGDLPVLRPCSVLFYTSSFPWRPLPFLSGGIYCAPCRDDGRSSVGRRPSHLYHC